MYDPSNPLVDFFRPSYNDLCICRNDPRDYNPSGGRILLAEVFIQQFKLFSKMTKLIYFKWMEKKLHNTDHIWQSKEEKEAIKLFELFAYIYVSKIMTYIRSVYLLF